MNDNSGQKKSVGSSAPKKESILELAKLMDATVKVKCIGGRELQGVLRGYDDLVNLVLDDCEEFLRGEFKLCWFYLKLISAALTNCLLTLTYHCSCFLLSLSSLDPEDIERVTDKTRKLGLIVVRGTQVSLVSPQEGVEEIANPFLAAEE
jgi:U6 snRNA-associated Sm-like protein LSm7